jgi:two-component system sensor histidine kinase/response regulator
VKCITKDGKIVHTVSSIEMMEMIGETYLVSFFVDITKIIKQQSIIEQHVQQLEAVNKELEAFSYSVSHDLRAPLRAIDGYTKILQEDFYPLFNDEGKKTLSAVQRNTQKMGNLIDDLLAFAKLGKRGLQKSDIDMNELVREVVVDLKNEMDYATQIRIGTLHSVKGDYSLIKQVMINLISNAVKYSSKKEQPVVDVTSSIEDKGINYRVTDNGAGFDMQYVDKLFGVFQRLHTSSEFDGTGVGLAIVQRIINKHGGTVRAEAEVGKGASFIFQLPFDTYV